MKFILFFMLPLLAICLVLHLLAKRAKRRADRLMKESEADERRQASLFTGQHINSIPIIDWEDHRNKQRARAAGMAGDRRITQAGISHDPAKKSRRDDSDEIMNPLNPLSPLHPAGQINMMTISTLADNNDEPSFSGDGGSFGGAGSSASWETSTCHDDSSSRHSSYGGDSGSSYSSSDNSSYSSSDSGSSSSSCD